MQWNLIGSSPGNVHEYHLLDAGKIQLVLKYNPSQQSARIFFDGKQRLVYLEKVGFWNPSTVFKNEYGIQLGKITYEKWQSQSSGVIEMEGKKYFHIRSNNSRPETVVYEKDIQHPILTCSLNTSNNGSEIAQPYYKEDEQEYTGLLIGLCWPIFMPRSSQDRGILSAQHYPLSMA